MTAVPAWMRPPRPDGWYADDLDHIPEAPRHTELFDGALAFRMSPQRCWHARLVTALVLALTERAPAGIDVELEMTIRLDELTRSYVPTAIHRHELRTTTPFTIELDLDKLVPGRKS